MTDFVHAERTRVSTVARRRVSVLMPTYNHERWIGAAIESILDQVGVEIELVIVDDGSTDDTSKVIDRFDDPRITRDRFPVNRGKIAAFNRCFELATGDFIACCASDDVLGPGSLAARSDAITAGAGGAWHRIQPCDRDLRPLSGSWTGRDWTPADLELVLRYPPISGGVLMPARRFAEPAFPLPSSLAAEDWWITIQALAHGAMIEWVDGPMLIYRLHGGNASGTTTTIDPPSDPDLFVWNEDRSLGCYDAIISSIPAWPVDRTRELERIARDNRDAGRRMVAGRRTFPSPRRLRSLGPTRWLLLNLVTIRLARRHWSRLYRSIESIRSSKNRLARIHRTGDA